MIKHLDLLALVLALSLVVAAGCKKEKEPEADEKEAVALCTISIWQQPGDQYAQGQKWVATVKRGERLFVKPSINAPVGWMSVRLTDGSTTGWTQSQYYYIGKRQEITFTDETKIFVRPDENSEVIRKAKKGDYGILVGHGTEGWLKANISKDKWFIEGWIKEGSFERGKVEIKDADKDKDTSGKVFKTGRYTVTASSWVQEAEGYSYTPDLALDGKMDTCWQVNKGDTGIGEWIELRGLGNDAHAVSLVNGFAHNDSKFGDLYMLNARVKRVKVQYGDSLQNSTTVDLMDNNGNFQDLGVFNSDRVRIVIEAVYPGKKWQDTSVSEIRIGDVIP